MPDQDVQSDVVKGLVAEQAKLERLAAEMSAEFPKELAPVGDQDQDEANSWYNSRVAESIGFAAGRTIGEVLVELGKSLIPTPEERELAAARARAAIASTHPAPAAIPVPAQATPASPVENKGIDLVGHRDEDRRAPSPLLTEPFSTHTERLDLETDVRDQVR